MDAANALEIAALRRRVAELEAENARLTQQLAVAAASARAGSGGAGGGAGAGVGVSSVSGGGGGSGGSVGAGGGPPPLAVRRGSVGGAALAAAAARGASPLPSPPAEAAAAAAEPSAVCANCGRAVPAASLSMHALHCARNTARCASCGAAVAARELEAHLAAERGTPSALAQAAAAGDAAAVERMLQHGQPAGVVCGAGGSGDLALHVAARHRRAAVAELLIARGCPVNAANAAGETPLHVACASAVPLDEDERGGSGGGGGAGGAGGGKEDSGSAAGGAAARAAASAEALCELVALLVRRGGDVEARTPLGDSATNLAQRARNHDVLLLLGGALPGRPASRDARSRPGSGRLQLPGLGAAAAGSLSAAAAVAT